MPHADHPDSQRWLALVLGIVGPVPELSLGESLHLDHLQAVELCLRREPDQKRALLLQQPTEQVVAHVTRVADQEHALEDRLGERLQQIDQVATFPRLGCPQIQDQRTPVVKLTKAITHSVGADCPCWTSPSSVPTPRARTFHPRAVTPQRQPTFHGHAIGQEVKDATARHRRRPTRRAWANAAAPAKAAKRLARSLSLGAMNLSRRSGTAQNGRRPSPLHTKS